MIRCGNRNRIDLIAQLRQHFTIVLVAFSTGILLLLFSDLTSLRVDITETENLDVFMSTNGIGVRVSLAAGSDVGGADPAVR